MDQNRLLDNRMELRDIGNLYRGDRKQLKIFFSDFNIDHSLGLDRVFICPKVCRSPSGDVTLLFFVIIIVQIERQIILTVGKNKWLGLFRFVVIAFIMLNTGVGYLGPDYFQGWWENDQIMNRQVNEQLPNRLTIIDKSWELQIEIDSLDQKKPGTLWWDIQGVQLSLRFPEQPQRYKWSKQTEVVLPGLKLLFQLRQFPIQGERGERLIPSI